MEHTVLMYIFLLPKLGYTDHMHWCIMIDLPKGSFYLVREFVKSLLVIARSRMGVILMLVF